MSTNDNQDQEIDLGQISKKVGEFFEGISTKIFKGMLFIKKNFILFISLFVIGIFLGFLLDSTIKTFDNQVIVTPNFGTTEYLYSKIDLINSKITQNDTVFLKAIGIKDFKNLKKIKVEPIIDIYSFVNNNTAVASNAQNTQNFELVKLLAEDGDINKVIKDKLTSKNYSEHTICISTSSFTTNKNLIDPILLYLNKNDYYQKIQKMFVENINIKMKEDQIIINQIDVLLNQFTATTAANQKSDKLVYYNENSQLNDILGTKNGLISGIGYQKAQLISIDKIIKDKSRVLNIKNTKGTNNKMKLVLPILLVFGFLFISFFKSFYRKQTAKSKI
ncbi:hypothetical protein [Flavobacterium sp.]|uniref:hypothetical protein n=1 Tax=Flavobacterium sp. TaxID=239 RepID=UPI0037526FE0